MSAKRSMWAVIGRTLWAVIRFVVRLVLRVVAALGSRWARKKLDQHAEKKPNGAVGKVLHPSRR